MRIAKFIAGSGVCSRRRAEKLIEQGKVSIDGQIIDSPAINVSSDNNVSLEGKRLRIIDEIKLWLYYKPVGLITTYTDPKGRPTVFDSLKHKLPKVISVGRLDINSEGLLLLTNSGDLAGYLEAPVNNIERIYKVRVLGRNMPVELKEKTIKIEGVRYTPKLVRQTGKSGANSWYEVILTEGKNREIRKIFNHFGFQVNRLIRTNFGRYSLGNLKPGEFKEVKIYENYLGKV